MDYRLDNQSMRGWAIFFLISAEIPTSSLAEEYSEISEVLHATTSGKKMWRLLFQKNTSGAVLRTVKELYHKKRNCEY